MEGHLAIMLHTGFINTKQSAKFKTFHTFFQTIIFIFHSRLHSKRYSLSRIAVVRGSPKKINSVLKKNLDFFRIHILDSLQLGTAKCIRYRS